MTPSIRSLVLAAGLLASLAALAQTTAEDVSPDGGGCAGAVARWQEIAARENKGGFMGDGVYAQIQAETERASHLCQAGQDAEARKAVVASMRRHGY